MRKLFSIAILGAAMFAGFNASAQAQGDIRVTVAGLLGTESAIDDNGEAKMGFGLNVGGEYFVSDAISAGASYDMFFKSEVGGASVNYSSINIDGRYYFGEMFYGLAGLSLAKATSEFSGFKVSANETGANIGAGAIFAMGDSAGINVQVKYNTPLEQIVGQVGVSFSF